MTPAQDSALKAAYEKLSEHFDAFIIVSLVEIDHPKGGMANASHISYSGGLHTALGLLAAAKHQLLTDPPVDNDDSEGDNPAS